MEKMITQDFEFKENSLELGKFLVECYESYPTISIEKIPAGYYKPKTGFLYLTINIPEEFAVILKLKFGIYLVQRPAKMLYKQEKDMLLNRPLYKYEWDENWDN